jgi:tetratricopeptide (TPR) repeat protein
VEDLDMSKDTNLFNALKKLDIRLAELNLRDAVLLIDKEISETILPEYRPYYIVRKASILYAAGQLNEAADLLKQCAIQHENIDSVNFFAGQYLLELGQYKQAIDYLSQCIKICKYTREDWFLDSAHLLRAYCAAKICNAELAFSDLAQVDDDEAMTWIEVKPLVSKQSIAEMLVKT